MEELVARLKDEQLPDNNQPRRAAANYNRNLVRSMIWSGPQIKIGFWPVQSETQPEVAMGIATLLCYLLEECYSNVHVYPLFAQVEGVPEQYEWVISRSQFGVDDWELDGLDENVAIWGTLNHINGQWQLVLEIENDLAKAGEDLHRLETSGATIKTIVARLPALAAEIAAYVNAEETTLFPVYDSDVNWDENKLENLLKAVFHWELNMFLSLWGKPWMPQQIRNDIENLLDLGRKLGGNLAAWVATCAVAEGLQRRYEAVHETLADYAALTVETFAQYDFLALLISWPLYHLGFRREADDLLENNVLNHDESANAWIVLGNHYTGAGEFAAAIDAFQRALEAGVESSELYYRYARLLIALDAQDVAYGVGAREHTLNDRSFVEGFILIDPEETESDWLLWEATEALQAALELEPERLDILSSLVFQLVDLDESQVWNYFAQLVELDSESEYLHNVVDTLYGLTDVSPTIPILQKARVKYPEREDLRLSLAAVYLMNNQPDEAEAELNALAQTTTDSQVKSEIDRLRLSVDDSEFEARFGEISDLVSSNNQLGATDVEFLEEVLKKAPNFLSAYVVLANAYILWDEADDALEVLLDGQRKFPNDPDILVLLGRVLWNSGEKTLALDYLQKGLTENPDYVPLLATTGRYLFDDGKDEEARLLLLRAEALDSRHPILREVRAYIAGMVNSE